MKRKKWPAPERISCRIGGEVFRDLIYIQRRMASYKPSGTPPSKTDAIAVAIKIAAMAIRTEIADCGEAQLAIAR